ncbi:unnamed protein product [Calypogeia fissa]
MGTFWKDAAEDLLKFRLAMTRFLNRVCLLAC